MITTKMLDEFRKDLNEALKPLEQKYGLSIDVGRITYSPNDFSLRLSSTDVKEAMKNGLSPEKAIWDANCKLYGFKEDDFNKTISLQGRNFKIVGITPNCRKNGILIEDMGNNKTYKTSYESALNAIAFATNMANRKSSNNATK